MATWTQHPNPIATLTERQREVLGLLAAGRTNPEIADLLGMSLAGAKWHVSEVISRLGVVSREEAVEIWREEHALPRRFSNGLRAVLGFATVKTAAATAGATALAAGVIGIAAIATSAGTAPDDPAPVVQAAPTEFPNALYTRTQAATLAFALADKQFDLYDVPAAVSKDGRPVTVQDLSVGFYNFIENATEVRNTLSNSSWPNGEGRNVWTFELTAEGLQSDLFGTSMVMSIVFEDGGTEVLGAGIMWPTAPAAQEQRGPAYPIADQPVGSFSSGAESWTIMTAPHEDAWVLGLRNDGESGGGSFGPIGPDIYDRDTLDLFGVTVFETRGHGYVLGAVSDNVARLEVVVEDGRSATLLPQEPPAGSEFPYRAFGAAFPGAAWVVEVHAFDGDGNEVAATLFRDHPTNP